MNKLKIAQIVNIWQSIPPIGYGGTESVVADLTEGLVKKGHDVTLFTTGDSKTSAHQASFFQERLLHKNIPWNNYLYPLTHFLWAYDEIKKSGEFDIIHGHLSLASDFLSLAFASGQIVPSIFTLHFPLPLEERTKDRRVVFEYLKNMNFVSISNSQRKLPLRFAATVYHGINVGDFPFSQESSGDSIVWVGRIVPEKGLEDALEVAKRLGRKLVIGARVDKESESNLNYYKTQIEHKLQDTLVTNHGEITREKRNELLTSSRCFIFPIHWEEPFGLVMIESMACGTPVIAYARGSTPEVIKDGETGFLVNSSDDDIRGDFVIKKTGIEGLCEAVEKIYAMPEEEYKAMRRNCRAHVEKNFTVERMVDEYEKVYYKLLT